MYTTYTHKEIVSNTTKTISKLFTFGRELCSAENAEKVQETVEEILKSPTVGNAIEAIETSIEENPIYQRINYHIDKVVMEQLTRRYK